MSNLITKISLWQTLDKFWHWEVVRYSGQDHQCACYEEMFHGGVMLLGCLVG